MWDFDKYKNKVAVISDKGQVISYGELNNRIRNINIKGDERFADAGN